IIDKKMTIITLEMSDLNSFILSVLITEYGNGCGSAIAKPKILSYWCSNRHCYSDATWAWPSRHSSFSDWRNIHRQ
ncbi:hypothetical protein, partial [Moraxella catarrhalis]|uniref:hypothetical protein n=1 Tax=Moraxella catarrhalis TaxID=480 RepID=UPI001C7D55D0